MTFCTGHIGNTFGFLTGGVDAVERGMCHGGTSSICRPQGRGGGTLELVTFSLNQEDSLFG